MALPAAGVCIGLGKVRGLALTLAFVVLAIPVSGGARAAAQELRASRDILDFAFAVVVRPSEDATALTAFATRMAREFPTYWSASTEGLSVARVAAKIAVVRTDNLGSSYDSATEFYRTNPDAYDFLTFFYLTTSVGAPDRAGGGHANIRIAGSGLGSAVGESGLSLPPGTERLLGTNDILVRPSDLAAEARTYMWLLLHESHHAWCCRIRLPERGGLGEFGLLSTDRGHWTEFLVTDGMHIDPLGPNTLFSWVEGPLGTFSRQCRSAEPSPATFRVSPLSLYLMGLLPPDQMPPIAVIVPAQFGTQASCDSPIRARKVAVSIADIIAANGYAVPITWPGHVTVAQGFHSSYVTQSASVTIPAGQKAWAWVAFKNTGSETWIRGSGSEVRLGTRFDDTFFAAARMAHGWLAPTRPTAQGEYRVQPNEIAVFGFQIVGTTPGRYRLELQPLVEGVTWLEDEGVYLDVTVLNSHHSRWVDQSAYPTLAVGQGTAVTVRFRNTGSSTWVKGTATEARLGLNLDDPTISNLGMAVGWPFPERPSIQTEPSVPPGQIATFSFTVKGTTPGVYHLHLRPVIDGVTWMEDEGVFFTITVR